MADTNLDITVTSKGIKEAQAALKKLETEAANAEKASKKLADAAKKLEDKFKLEAAAIGKTADQVKILKLEQSGATKAQIEAAKSALSYKEKTLQAAWLALACWSHRGLQGTPWHSDQHRCVLGPCVAHTLSRWVSPLSILRFVGLANFDSLHLKL